MLARTRHTHAGSRSFTARATLVMLIAFVVATAAGTGTSSAAIWDPTPTPTPTATPTPTPNWQTALSSAKPGDVIVIPEGTFTLTQGRVQFSGADIYCNLVIPSGVTLKGSGIGKTILVGAGTTSCNVIGSIRTTGIAISDMTLMVDASRRGNTSQDGIKLEDVNGATITNVELRNFYIGTNCIGSRNVTYSGCIARDCELGIDVINLGSYTGTDNVLVKDCLATGCNQWGFGCYNDPNYGSDVHVSGVTFQNCDGHDNNTGLFGWYADSLTVTGGSFNNNHGDGVKLNTCRNYLVGGVTATGNPNGNFVYVGTCTPRT